jgi:lysophospholipase L1-like esterase
VPAAIIPERPTSWWGRIIKQRRASAASAFVVTGSSTSAIAPGYVAPLAALLQAKMYPDAPATPVKWSNTATFEPEAAAGLHVYSAAEGGTTSSNYLDAAEMNRIAALSPAIILHMVGANDYTQQVNPATYKTNLLDKLAHFDSVLTAPCQHVFVHAYAHRTFVPVHHQFAAYGAALAEIAASRPDTAWLDLSAAYAALGIPGADPLAFILDDNTHQTPDGYAFMVDLIYKFLTT